MRRYSILSLPLPLRFETVDRETGTSEEGIVTSEEGIVTFEEGTVTSDEGTVAFEEDTVTSDLRTNA